MNKPNKVISLFLILLLLCANHYDAKNDLQDTPFFHSNTGSNSYLCVPIHTSPLLFTIDTDFFENLNSLITFSKLKSNFYSLAIHYILNLFLLGIIVFISIFSLKKYRNKFLSSVSLTETLF